MSTESVLEGLDPEQREVVTAPIGPLCVLAGAGTGKTRAITHRIAYGVHSGLFQPQRVLAVTFTARAAGEMRTRLRDLGVAGVQARTFHAAALRQLTYFWPRAVGGAPPGLLSQKAGAVAEAGGRLGLRLDRAAVRDLAAEIEWAKVSGLSPETYPAAARAAHREPPGVDVTAMARLLDAYQEVLSGRGAMDFEDVLLLTCAILADREDIAREVRGQYRHFVVDEYQDVNAVQQRLLELWLGERRDVCVVGDPSQTIYTFTGATPRFLVDFPRRHPQATVVRLVRNYRSSPQIVSLANLVLTGAQQQGREFLPVTLQAQGRAGRVPTLTTYADEEAEARGIADQIGRLMAQGVAAADIAILYRTNGQSGVLEQALAAAGVSYVVKGGERFFRRDEVRRAMVLLRGAARSDDGSVPLPELTRDVLAGLGWSQTPPSSSGAVRERWESLTALAHVADDVAAAAPQARLAELVTELSMRAEAQHAPTVQGVTLASLHAAKGLEWEVVFLAGCSDGYLPISMAQGTAAVEEERRLFYVGVTRARRDLWLSWAAARQPGGRASRRPSRFLEGAAAMVGMSQWDVAKGPEVAKAPARSARVRRCRGCGAVLATAAERKLSRCEQCPPTYDEATFERMRSWRAEVARRESVPAYVVFTDATLMAIAEAEPQDAAQLARISGVGARKLAKYGEQVLALMTGADPHGQSQVVRP
ncbi:ATP-dependent DNA helicase UvrD2 [Austwickia sp. TVS 96-490-7B]|nr:ATP-dependent DNA helicase UvrD2 [Austwickia sp. TVS 96-490-7B]MBW3086620.1 ATP-dependent DNA helicase UvrD2 [Austwickia sp. TVS 96-490-7B]